MAVDGTYRVTGEGMGLQLTGTIDLATSGSTLSGTAHLHGEDLPIEDGKVSGNDVTGTVVAPTPMGTLKFKVNATVEGDKISGTLKALMVKATFAGERIS